MHRRQSVALAGLAAVLLALFTASAALAAAPRGLVEPGLLDVDASVRTQRLTEIGGQLGARYLRLPVDWDRAEPAAGVDDEAYLGILDETVATATSLGIKVVLTVARTPRWASETALWSDPPFNYQKNQYFAFYAPAAGHVDEFGAFAQRLAARPALQGKVFAYECWNEPNLWVWFYPQRRDGAANFAADRYFELLKAFHAGIAAADPAALVIGGATAPFGEDDTTRSSPQRFAQRLAGLGAAGYLDAYSHHPYVPGGSPDVAPEAAPRDPDHTVQLRNLGVLLALFPDKAFYLTEFGYNTSFSAMFGGLPVSPATQADYLRRALRYAGRYPQVKGLFWYLLGDQSPSGRTTDPSGVYTGLRTIKGARKAAWFTYAGGVRLTLSAPTAVRRGTSAVLRGVLSCSRLSPSGLPNKPLRVERRSGGKWVLLKTVRTGTGGAYRTSLRPTTGAGYRVVWSGVAASAVRVVAVR